MSSHTSTQQALNGKLKKLTMKGKVLAFFAMMASVTIAHVASNKYIVLSQGTCAIHDNNCN